jgi:hypothetical protein
MLSLEVQRTWRKSWWRLPRHGRTRFRWCAPCGYYVDRRAVSRHMHRVHPPWTQEELDRRDARAQELYEFFVKGFEVTK